MTRVLISACLLGRTVRYDGGHKALADPRIARWQAEGRLVALCPEMAGGMPVPRPPAEVRDGRVVELGGADVTEAFRAGAEAALRLCREHGIRHALLIDDSPSCGSASVYDGTFSGRRIPGRGVTAEALIAAGIDVYTPDRIDALAAALREKSDA